MEFITWFFSGIGTKIIDFLSKNNTTQPIEKPDSTIVSSNKLNEPAISLKASPKVITEVQTIAKRLNLILELMNKSQGTYNKFTIAGLAKILKLDSVYSLEKYFTGQENPSFKFISSFCLTFGINESWLLEGKEEPYSNNDCWHTYALSSYNDIVPLKPEKIFFLRANTDQGHTFILLKHSNWKYQVFKKVWHLSDHVGGSGRKQLLSLYKLIRKLKKNKIEHDFICTSITLDSDLFFKINSGRIFPGNLIDHKGDDYWSDDLLDLNHKCFNADSYRKNHGVNFINAQKIINSELSY